VTLGKNKLMAAEEATGIPFESLLEWSFQLTDEEILKFRKATPMAIAEAAREYLNAID